MKLLERNRAVYWLNDILYLNITNKCSNNCYFCFRKLKHGIREFNLKLKRDPTEKEVINQLQEVIKKRKWKEIVFCGFGEPLERLDVVLKISKWIKKYHPIPIRINTNGQGYLINKNRKVIQELIKSGVNKIKVSLNAHNKITYNQICNPKFDETFESIIKFIKKANEMGLKTEVTAVTIPEIEITKVNEFANKMGVKFSPREYIRFFW